MNNSSQITELTADQKLVFEDMVEALEMIRSFTKNEEPETGDLTWVAGSIGRALRLKNILADELIKPFIEPMTEAVKIFREQEAWLDEVVLETSFQAVIDEFETCFKDPETTPLALMGHLIEMDKLFCALSFVSESITDLKDYLEKFTFYIQAITEVYLEASLKVSKQAKKFKLNQGVTGSWGQVWQSLIEAEERYQAIQALYQEAEELDLKQPVKEFDFFSKGEK